MAGGASSKESGVLSFNGEYPASQACAGPAHFSGWYPLDAHHTEKILLPGPTAIQVRAAEGLIDYPRGKSAMLYFCFAVRDPKSTMEDLFADELIHPGCRGRGALWFRVLQGSHARKVLENRWEEFVERFGQPPLWQDFPSASAAVEK